MQSFFIRRFLCKDCGRTLSVHPRFSHRYKRYSLKTVVDSVRGVATGVCDRTVKRWRAGMRAGQAVKIHLLQDAVVRHSDENFLHWLIRQFFRLGEGDPVMGAAEVMVGLDQDHAVALY